MNYYIKNMQINKIINFKIFNNLKLNYKNKIKINKIIISKTSNNNINKQINNNQHNN